MVPAPDGFFEAHDRNEYTFIVTIPKLTDELLSFQRSSRCPADCWLCGSKKGQLPPFEFTFIDDEDASPSADHLVVTRCEITATRHFPSSIDYDTRYYFITAFGYSKHDFWRLCLGPLMNRVELSSLRTLVLDWSHVQVLELHGREPMALSSSTGDTDNTQNQDLLTRPATELLAMILLSSTCQIFHLDIGWRSIDNTGLFWDAVARCRTLSILTLKNCDLLAEIPSSSLLSPTSGPLLASSDKNHVDISSSTVQDQKLGNLRELTIQECSLDENSLDSLCQLLRNTTKSLQHAVLVNNIWPLDAGCKVVSSFTSHTHLESLEFRGLNDDYSTIQAIGQLMKSSPSLQKLNISQFPQVIDVRPLADGLLGSNLNELDLSSNRLINLGTLAIALHENQNLHTLNLSKTTIHEDDDSEGKKENTKTTPSTFFANLGDTRGLEVLILDEAKLCNESIDELAQSLRTNTSLDSLHLKNIGGSVSLASIFDSLQDIENIADRTKSL